MLLFEWLGSDPIKWGIVLGICFAIAAIVVLDPCAISSWDPVFALGSSTTCP